MGLKYYTRHQQLFNAPGLGTRQSEAATTEVTYQNLSLDNMVLALSYADELSGMEGVGCCFLSVVYQDPSPRLDHVTLLHKILLLGWRDGSQVKSTGRGPEFNSRNQTVAHNHL